MSNIFDDDFDKYVHTVRKALEELEETLTKDYSNYVYVDGEEGDHGKITYYNEFGRLVASHYIFGGDQESFELTEVGKAMLRSVIIDALY